MKKKLMVLTASFAICTTGKAQSDDPYTMSVYLSDGSVEVFSVSEVDSVVYSENVGNSSVTTYINGYAAVDLGLSVKWATCNIGADPPEDYGNYYAWGETETKDSYTSSSSVTYGVEMDDIAGDAGYDAATANWGGSWRMPTWDEMDELVDSCTWEWTTQNEVNGYLITGSSGNSIFLPAAGYRYGAALFDAGSLGYFWSSTPLSTHTSLAYNLYFYSSYHFRRSDYRLYGRTVRPVSE